MGLDLAICPIKWATNNTWWLGHERLSFDRNYGLFSLITDVGRSDEPVEALTNPKPLPPECKFEWYGDEGVKAETTDPYGEKLTYVYASELAKLVDCPEFLNFSGWNKAILLMMKALPSDIPVVLWWH